MPALSRAQAKTAFEHVVRKILHNGKADGPIEKALSNEGIGDIGGLISISDNTIGNLQYKSDPTDTSMTPLNGGSKRKIEIFLSYYRYREACMDGTAPIDVAWDQIAEEDFDAYCLKVGLVGLMPITVTTTATTAKSTTSAPVLSEVESFKRGIKRDLSAFPPLKDEKFHDSWHRSILTQARAQDIDDVLNTTYKPNTTADAELFALKQKFFYAVLEKTVMTDRGKAIVRKYEAMSDAQKAYGELCELHMRSTKAQMESSDLLAYITSARLGNGDWKGSNEGFITHWQDQLRLYEKQVPPSDYFSDGQKRQMLENCVAAVPELRNIKTAADMEKTRTGRSLTYDEYANLLMSAATSYDRQFKGKPKRMVYMHDLGYDQSYDHEDIQDGEDYFDIDSPVSTIQAFAAQRRFQRGKPSPRTPARQDTLRTRPQRLQKEKWYQLSDEAKQTWDMLSEQDKAIIIGTTSTPVRHVHNHTIYQDESEEFQDASDGTPAETNIESTLLVNAASRKLPPGDIRRVLSSSDTRSSSNSSRQAHVSIVYSVMNYTTSHTKSLVDRGANGGIAGNDVRIIDKSPRTVNVQGIDNHQVTDLAIGTVGGVINTQHGPVIAIFHQYAILGKGHSIHSPAQLEAYKVKVDEKSIHVGGTQCIRDITGYVIPLSIAQGLARLPIRPYTDREWDTLPHVVLTADVEWDPCTIDHDLEADQNWFDAISAIEARPGTNLFDEYGNYRHRIVLHCDMYLNQDTGDPYNDTVDRCVFHAQHNTFHQSSNLSIMAFPTSTTPIPTTDHEDTLSTTIMPRLIKDKKPDYAMLRPQFGWLSADRIQRTFQMTTQYGRIPHGTLLKRHYRSPNPALNVRRRSEPIACDIVYSDSPAIDDGSATAVIFVGLNTHVTDVYGIKTDKQFINTLEDVIRERGAPTKLISDRAQVEISEHVQDILRALCISAWQSEPHQQQQNYAERRWQTIKTATNRIMDRTAAPAYTWLLCLKYTCFLFNHMYDDTIKQVPLTALLGSTVDISVLLRFHFWQEVYYKLEDSDFPSDSKEASGRIVGVSEAVGSAMTYMILTKKTSKVIYRSQVRPALSDKNFRAEFVEGEKDSSPPQNFVKSRGDEDEFTKLDSESLIDTPINKPPDPTPVFDPEDLVGRTFIMDPDDKGQKFRARIVQLLEDHESRVQDNPTRIKFLCKYDEDKAEEIFTYNQVLDHITRDPETDIVWQFKKIVSHQGPLSPSHPDYNGSSYNVVVEWENGETTSEPLKVIAADDPVSCAIYARENGLLDTAGWKQFKGIAKRENKFMRLVNQAKLRSFRTAPRYKYGFEVPRDYNHAMRLDEQAGSNKWAEAVKTELEQIDEYNTFQDMGHIDSTQPPQGYKKIRVHFVFDIKHDGRHKARLVADGHLTDVPLESVYSGVVSLRSFRMVVFLAELNKHKLWATDIGNAYLEAHTNEKLYIVGGPEFGARQSHILVIDRALYGLKSSGARWHDRFSDCMRDLGFFPCKADSDVWMRPNGEEYEYVAVYVDDLAIAMKDPQAFVNALTKRYNFKLKGTGPIQFHLGMDFYRDKDGTLCIASKKYIEKLLANYEQLFGKGPKQNVMSPIDQNDHPELDISDLLDEEGITQYQSLIGALQWIVTIGRFDINTAVMTLSAFRAAPRKGHLERIKRIFGYLAKMKQGAIRVRVEEPDFSDIPDQDFDWSRSVYGEPTELIPNDAPKPMGKHVTLSHFVDANLMHDLISGKSVTGILHLINKTPIDWYSKKQATVETATYGSEFVAARTCVEQIIDLRLTLRYLGVPIRDKSYMFGDNESVVNSSNVVHAKIHKRHMMLSFHRVREVIASKMLSFTHIKGAINPADILSKHWTYSVIWPQLRPLLFWEGDTASIDEKPP
jgi:hypothetical protein